MKLIAMRRKRRSLLGSLCLSVVLAGGMLLGSYALAGCGDGRAAAENSGLGAEVTTLRQAEGTGIFGTVVSQVKNTPDLDPGVMVISVPLNVEWKQPGKLYGGDAQASVQLGPKDVPGMTQDAFGARAGILLPDGRRLLYHFWEQVADFPTEAPGDPVVEEGTRLSTPTVRMYDLASGADNLVVSGARSMAWRSDGLLAYARGVEPDYRYNLPYLQQVIVQQGLDGPPEAWTAEADCYTVLQWVKDSLLVWREFPGESGELLVLSRPGQMTKVLDLGERFLAAGPDGELILAANSSDTGAPVIRVIDWEAGGEVARLSLEGVCDPAGGGPITGVDAAAWEGNTVVAALYPAHLAVLSVGDGTLRLENVVTFSYPGLLPGSGQDLLLDESAGRVRFVAREGPGDDKLERTAVITYDLTSGECLRWVVPDTEAVTRLVSNPSRPR